MSREPLRALVVDEVPLWDAEVRAVISELREWLSDTSEAPIIKREAISGLCKRLELMVYRLDEGKWMEGVLAPHRPQLEAASEPDTAVLPSSRSVWEQAALEFDRRAAERLPWLEEVSR